MSEIPLPLVKASGMPFEDAELETLVIHFESLSDKARESYRNDNSRLISEYVSEKLLIVSGPGTGKSHIFKGRIAYWLRQNQSAGILALSFVRKLVADLETDIRQESSFSDQQKSQVDVFTLHKFARSVVEQNHGIARQRFEPHIKIVSGLWLPIVWNDTLILAGETDQVNFSEKKFKKQLHDNNLNTSLQWRKVQAAYFKLSKFYNAVGFSDLIVYAQKAIEENPLLVGHQYFIVDEYQDFNTAEEQFIKTLTSTSSGTLTAGDDDQVLYEELRSGKPSLIRGLYCNIEFVNAMLPFCGRSSFHIAKTAGFFIKQSLDPDSITKIYLPISTDTSSDKVQIIGCATPSASVDYIRKFIETHQGEIDVRRTELENGSEKDPFLMILTPSKDMNFYRLSDANKELSQLIESYQGSEKKLGEDYYKVLAYYSLANHPENNFTFRKVLNYENVQNNVVIDFVKACLVSNRKFYELSEEDIIDNVLQKSQNIKAIMDSTDEIDEKVENINNEINISDTNELKIDLERSLINENQVLRMEHEEDESAELAELQVKQMAAVELLTIAGSKGLSADHVIIIGFDNVNMARVKRNSFYVALTRARKSLHLITALKSGGALRAHDYLNSLPEDHLQFFKYKKTGRVMDQINNKQAFVSYLELLSRRR